MRPEQYKSTPSWIQTALASLLPVRKRFNPAVIPDPMARQIEWSPAKGGGANFCTHKLMQVNANRVQFKPTILAWVFYFVFVVVGAGVVFASVLEAVSGERRELGSGVVVPALIGCVFLVTGSLLLYFGTAPVVFDRYRSAFWKGRRSPDAGVNRARPKHFAPLGDIYALQILSELCSRSKGGSFYSYELNLVLNDKRRINVVDHGNLRRLREDARTLSEFLGKPVWDALEYGD